MIDGHHDIHSVVVSMAAHCRVQESLLPVPTTVAVLSYQVSRTSLKVSCRYSLHGFCRYYTPGLHFPCGALSNFRGAVARQNVVCGEAPGCCWLVSGRVNRNRAFRSLLPAHGALTPSKVQRARTDLDRLAPQGVNETYNNSTL